MFATRLDRGPLLVDLPPISSCPRAARRSVVGVATGWAIGRDEPALVLLHTTAGSATPSAPCDGARRPRAARRARRTQDRRHLATSRSSPAISRARRHVPCRSSSRSATDVPGAIGRASHAATTRRGPALVVVPMDDWSAPAPDEGDQPAAAGTVLAPPPSIPPPSVRSSVCSTAPSAVPRRRRGTDEQRAGTRSSRSRSGSTRRLAGVVRRRGGFPQDHARFAGHLPSDGRGFARCSSPSTPSSSSARRRSVSTRRAGRATGSHQGSRRDGRPRRGARSVAELSARPGRFGVRAACRPARAAGALAVPRHDRACRPGRDDTLASAYVFSALAQRLPRGAVVLEEAPSSKPELHARIAARARSGS